MTARRPQERTVVLAAGDFPRRGGAARRILEEASRVVACDGAADAYRRRTGRWPDVVVGDLDSAAARRRDCEVVRDAAEDDNDLSKALALCRRRGWWPVTVLGATGRREDHAIGNVFRALEAGVEVVTDFGAFHPLRGRRTFACRRGAGVSVFAPDSRTKASSRGLRWPLAGVRFANLYCATLNRATGTRFTVETDRPAYVYVEGGR